MLGAARLTLVSLRPSSAAPPAWPSTTALHVAASVPPSAPPAVARRRPRPFARHPRPPHAA